MRVPVGIGQHTNWPSASKTSWMAVKTCVKDDGCKTYEKYASECTTTSTFAPFYRFIKDHKGARAYTHSQTGERIEMHTAHALVMAFPFINSFIHKPASSAISPFSHQTGGAHTGTRRSKTSIVKQMLTWNHPLVTRRPACRADDAYGPRNGHSFFDRATIIAYEASNSEKKNTRTTTNVLCEQYYNAMDKQKKKIQELKCQQP